MNVVNLRPEPPLSDIVARLRMLADAIERGEDGPFQSLVIFCVSPDAFRPTVYCFGNNPPRHELAGLLLHGANMTLTDMDPE